MDVKTFPELWGVGVVKITVVQKWDPMQIRNHLMKKLLSHWCHIENIFNTSYKKNLTDN